MNNKLRVLMVSLRFAPIKADGAERQLQRLCEVLAHKGVEVTVVTGRAGRQDVVKREETDGYRIFRIAEPALILNGKRRLNSYTFMISLALFLLKTRKHYDLIHDHLGGETAVVCQQMARLFSKPFITKIANSGPEFTPISIRKKPVTGRLFSRLLLNADKVVTLTKENQKRCLEVGYKPQQLVQIPNGVPLFELPSSNRRAELRKKLMGSTDIQFVVVSNLLPNKRIDLFIKALAELNGSIPPCRAYILGEGSELASVTNMVRKHKLNDRIFFPGHIDNVEDYLCTADIAVHPSCTEGMSNAILEQMSHALPVIAADIEPNKDIITDGKDGILFKNNDVESLKVKIRQLVNNAQLRKQIGAAARKTIEQKFSITTIADKYIETYKTMLQERSA
jgi:glycosyltransferase involved in cell wall biosynthesis